MKLNVQFRKLDPSQALIAYAQSKLDEVSRYLLKEGQAQVYLSKVRGLFEVEITINSREKYFKALSASQDAYEAIDMASYKLEKQFLKQKSIHKNHKKFDLSKTGKLRSINSKFEQKPVYSRLKKAA